jgi:hypothetical protein
MSSENEVLSPEAVAALEVERAHITKGLVAQSAEANPSGLVATAVEGTPSLRELIQEVRKSESPRLTSLGSLVTTAAEEHRQNTREGAQAAIAEKLRAGRQALSDWGLLKTGIAQRVAELAACDWKAILKTLANRRAVSDPRTNVTELVGALKATVDDLNAKLRATDWKDLVEAVSAAEALREITRPHSKATAGALTQYADRAAATVASTTKQVAVFLKQLRVVEAELEAAGASLVPAVVPEPDRLAMLEKERPTGGSSYVSEYIGGAFAEGTSTRSSQTGRRPCATRRRRSCRPPSSGAFSSRASWPSAA